LRKRAEQSARDKERHRRLLEERAKKKANTENHADSAEYIPPTPVSTHTTAHKPIPKSKFRQNP